jgi:gluconolactonase
MEFSRRAFLGSAAAAAAGSAMTPTLASANGVTAFAPNVDADPEHVEERYPSDVWVIHDDKMKKYRIGNTPLLRQFVGAYWAEGSAWNGVGRYVVFSDIPKNRQLRWDEVTGNVTLLRHPSNHSNGNTFDNKGRQLSCEHETARVVRYGYRGPAEVLAESFEGKQLNAPNDVIVHPDDGGIIFTDPGYGSHWWYEGNVRELQLPTSVYHIDDQTGKLTKLTDETFKPNGLCFSPDLKYLYVADTAPTHFDEPATIIRWDVQNNGRKLTNRKQLCTAELNGKMGFYDGIRCDVDGNIWCGAGWVGDGYDGVHVRDPSGALIGQILLPEICANLTFCAEHRNRLFMCGSQSIYTIYTAAQGAHMT